jgi:hypothetical protein
MSKYLLVQASLDIPLSPDSFPRSESLASHCNHLLYFIQHRQDPDECAQNRFIARGLIREQDGLTFASWLLDIWFELAAVIDLDLRFPTVLLVFLDVLLVFSTQ